MSAKWRSKSAPPDGMPIYRLLTGPDDAAFCHRVSEALALGYVLYGSPSVTFNGRGHRRAGARMADCSARHRQGKDMSATRECTPSQRGGAAMRMGRRARGGYWER